MKNILCRSCLFWVVFLFCHVAYSYSIKVKINGLKDSTCYLGYYFGQKKYTPVDTAKADANGNLLFSKKDKLKEGVYLIILPKIYLELIITNEQDITLETDTSDYVGKMKIKGSQESKLFYEFQKYMIEKSQKMQQLSAKLKQTSDPDSIKAINEKGKALQEEIKKYRDQLYAANPKAFTTKLLRAAEEPEVPDFKLPSGHRDSVRAFLYYRDKFLENLDFSDERMLRTPIFIPKVERYVNELTLQVPDSIIKSVTTILTKAEANKEIFKYFTATFTNTYETSSIMGQDAIFVYLAKNYYLKGKCFWADTAMLRKIKERVTILEPLLIGKTAPNIYLADTAGNYLPLHTIKSKYLVVIFWDAECGHCQKEVPKLFELYKSSLRSTGVSVYAATIERQDNSWMKFIKEKKLFAPGWFNVRDKYNHTDFRNVYDVYSTPVIYILDENKKIIAKRLGVDQIADFLKNYETRLKKSN
ncbi:MAG: DUF5106 domain-containing protein [Cytophagaceae bacterium]|nr:DUF5106 domain-containing protein [Cytophagaceae bacterium]MDW8456476.1 DUF5106 domain-containing protein [Cytophagaceae bacterium]